MQAKVFTPSGVANADFEPLATTPNALAYHFHSASRKAGTPGISKPWLAAPDGDCP